MQYFSDPLRRKANVLVRLSQSSGKTSGILNDWLGTCDHLQGIFRLGPNVGMLDYVIS